MPNTCTSEYHHIIYKVYSFGIPILLKNSLKCRKQRSLAEMQKTTSETILLTLAKWLRSALKQKETLMTLCYCVMHVILLCKKEIPEKNNCFESDIFCGKDKEARE